MPAELLKTTTTLPPADIEMGTRLRPVSEAGVAALMASIEQLGGVMKDPIHVRKRRDGSFVLLAGAHRLTAALRLGWETIPVTAWKCNDDFAAMMEIDDNLASAELTALDTAVFLAARKRVYERMHPGSGHGGARGNQHTGGWQTDTMSFCQTSARKFGISDRHVRRLVAVGEALSSDQVARLREARRPVGVTCLIQVSKIGDPDERDGVVDKLWRGTARNAATARKQVRAEAGQGPAPVNPTDAEHLALKNAWARARKTARRRFLADLVPEGLDPVLEERLLDG